MIRIGGAMKLERKAGLVLVLLAGVAVAGCASSAPARGHAPLVPMTDAVSTTTITSALEPDAPPAETAETPRVGKAQRALGDDAQRALDPKRTASREGKRPEAFADWK
jgi:hypothetical protein